MASLPACVRPSASITSSASPAPFHNLRLEHYTPEGFPAGWYVEAEASVGAKRGEVTLRPHTADRRSDGRTVLLVMTRLLV